MQNRFFSAAELERLRAALSCFLPHTNGEAVALTGGVAIQLHASEAGLAATRELIADVDFVASHVEAILPSVVNDLLVSHFHLPQPGYPKFMIQVVDPVTRVRIDVFPDLVGSITRSMERVVAGHGVRVLDAESIFDHKREGALRATPERPIDEKHYRDAVLLGRICNRRVEPVLSDCLSRDKYGMDLRPCERCEVSRIPHFPIASRQRVFEILGYN